MNVGSFEPQTAIVRESQRALLDAGIATPKTQGAGGILKMPTTFHATAAAAEIAANADIDSDSESVESKRAANRIA